MAKRNLRILRANGKQAAAYLRKSTDEQVESIGQQREAVLRYATKHGYDIVAEYVDSGISGVESMDKRLQFQQLISDAQTRKFDTVLAWDLSRISRSDPMETTYELVPLRRLGVQVATTDKPEPIAWVGIASPAS